MLHTQYVFVYRDTCTLVINFAPLKSNPSSATASNPLPSAKVDALIPRCHNPKRVQSDLGSELEQRQPVSLIIPTNQRSDKQATP